MSYKYKLLLSILGLSLSMSCFAQSDMYDPASVPTPNQSSLGLFGTIPVSCYTGTADVNIPIYSTTQRGVDLNISLCYNTSGLLMNQLPGWTGYNWTLMAGGAITRKINGRPDEINLKGTKVKLNLYTWYETARHGKPIVIYDNKIESYTNYFTNAVNQKANLTDSVDFSKIDDYDSAADIFFFNFMGISGKFFFGGDGNWKVVCDKNIDVIFDVNDSTNYIESLQKYYTCADTRWKETMIEQPKTIKGFTLVDEDGNQYIFGGDKNLIEYSIPLAAADAYCNTTQPWNAVSWMLKEVKDRLGNTIYTFDYSRGSYMAQVQNAYNVIKSIYYPQSGVATDSVHWTSTSPRGTLNAPLYLDGIHAQDGTDITFKHTEIPSSCYPDSLYPGINVWQMLEAEYPDLKYEFEKRKRYLDYPPNHILVDFYTMNIDSISKRINDTKLEKLGAIIIDNKRNSNNIYNFKEINFLYSIEKRLHLTSVILDDKTKYVLLYDGFDQLPTNYLTKQIDNWGYYNGIEYDQPISYQVNSDENGNRDYVNVATRSMESGKNEPRVPNIDYGKLGMLKRIYYPTGGYTEFEYEQNKCNKYMSADKQTYTTTNKSVPVGGLRIKSIATYDGDSLIGKKTYEYSLGELYSLPNSRYAWTYNTNDSKFHYVADMICSVIPLSNSFSSTLGYSTVKEIYKDGSYTVYQFSNFSSDKDDPSVAIVPGQQTSSPYDETCSRQNMCGKLKIETIYDSSNKIHQSTTYDYDSDTDYNQNHYVITTSLCRMHPLAGTAGSVYKLYYFNSGLKRKLTRTLFGEKWVTDIYTCERLDTTLTITPSKGKPHVKDIFKIKSETVSRGTHAAKTVYCYPFMESGTSNRLVDQFYFPVTCKKQYVDGVLIGGEKVTFFEHKGKIVPQYIYQFADDESQVKTYRQYLEYDSLAREKSYIDENGVSHYLIWNKYGQLTANIANSSGNGISEYSAISTMRSHNKSSLFTTKPIMANLYEYDTQGRLKTTMSANLQRMDYSYDVRDRLTKVEWNNKLKTKYTYYQNNNTSFDDSIGYHTSNYLHIKTSNPEKPGYIRVDYKLRYDVINPEIRIIHVYSNHVEAQETIDPFERIGKVWFNYPPSCTGAYKICLYDNGVERCEADSRLYY